MQTIRISTKHIEKNPNRSFKHLLNTETHSLNFPTSYLLVAVVSMDAA